TGILDAPLLTSVLAQIAPMPPAYFLAPVGAVAALIMAFTFYRWLLTNSEGDETMVGIAEAVRQGAMAYLRRQYRVVAMVFAILVVVLAILSFGLDLQPTWSVIGVPIAGL